MIAPVLSRVDSSPRRVLAHLAGVVGIVALFIVMVVTTPPSAGVNIGAAFVGLVITVLGAPWSVVAVFLGAGPFEGLPKTLYFVALFVPAFVNVAIHAAAVKQSRAGRPDA